MIQIKSKDPDPFRFGNKRFMSGKTDIYKGMPVPYGLMREMFGKGDQIFGVCGLPDYIVAGAQVIKDGVHLRDTGQNSF